MSEMCLRTRLLLSLQRALLGEIFPGLVSLWIEFDAAGVALHWVVDGRLSLKDKDSISSVEAEVQADFDAKFLVTSHVTEALGVARYGPHDEMTQKAAWVFQRRE